MSIKKPYDAILIMDIQHIYYPMIQAVATPVTEAAFLWWLADSLKRTLGPQVGNYGDLLDRVISEPHIELSPPLQDKIDILVYERFRVINTSYLYHIKKIRFVKGALWVIL